jgi:hypothetical protein
METFGEKKLLFPLFNKESYEVQPTFLSSET